MHRQVKQTDMSASYQRLLTKTKKCHNTEFRFEVIVLVFVNRKMLLLTKIVVIVIINKKHCLSRSIIIGKRDCFN